MLHLCRALHLVCEVELLEDEFERFRLKHSDDPGTVAARVRSLVPKRAASGGGK
jgi:hypothetical protein